MVPNKLQSFPWKKSQALYLCSDGVGVTKVSRSNKRHVIVSAYPIKFPNRRPNNNHRSAHTPWNFHMVGLTTFMLSAHTLWNSQTGGLTITKCVPSLSAHTPWNSQTGGLTVTMCVPSLWVHTPWNSQTGGLTVTMCVPSLSAHPPWNSHSAHPQTVCRWACRGRRGPQLCWLLLAGRSISGIRLVCRDWKSNCSDQAPSGHSPGEEREEIYM